jgi:glycosyltransferase involved in cell wall biosynthesis
MSALPVSVIPNSLDTTVFTPIKKAEARSTLHLPIEAKIVLFVAGSLDRWHKGFSELEKAFRKMKTDLNTFLVSLGATTKALNDFPQHLHLGRIRDDRSLACVYSAADVFVIPSLQDNLPNTVLESLACGTPVVGFDTGGIPDMVRPGETGLLAPAGDVDALQHAIETLLENPNLRAELSHKARRVAEQEYSLAVQSGRYLELYRALLAEHAAREKSSSEQ